MSLYQKHRPQDWEDFFGSDAEIQAFKSSIESPTRPHVYLLSGAPGCGKTSLARVAAEKLGATEFEITEINSANNRGIETAREIIEKIDYAPMSGGCKVFIIDECGQTSKEWQGAMLKPLEDTPSYCYFFLCTTDPQKLSAPLRSRCTQVVLSPLKPELIYRLLKSILKKEGRELPKDIIEEISENCHGSPRSGIVLLEKIMGMTDEKMMKEAVSIGEDVEIEVISLCRELIKDPPSWGNVTKILSGISEIDPEKIRMAVLGYMNSVLMKSNNSRAAVTIECFIDPHFNGGRAGVTLMCYQSIFSR